MLAVKNRFHGHGSLRYVYKNGQAVRSHLVSLKYTENKRRSTSRFAVVVSKKVIKSAVGRNRIRRRLYETIRLEQANLRGVYDCVFLVFSAEVLNLPPDELRGLVINLFEQATITRHE